jgi:hypothetical protein
MKIELGWQQSFSLAQVFAQAIHHRVIEMHLYVSARAIEQEFGEPLHECYTYYKRNDSPFTEFRDVQEAIRSLSDRWERRKFIGDIRYHFKAMREKHRTSPRWQEHVARVLEVRRKEAA